MAVTLQHIADRVGVSAPTVSQILSPTSTRAGLFSESTRDRVRKAADELGYRANAAARSTATGRFGAVTLLLSQHDNRSQLPPRLLDGIDEALAGLGLHLMVARLPDARLTDPDAMPKLLRELTSDGLLINYNAHIPTRMIDLIQQYRLPCVWINSKHDHNCVYPDDQKAGYDAARLLLDAGHTRVAFVDYTYGPSPKRCHYSNTDRRAGYGRAMDEAGLEPRLICGDGNIPLDQRIPFTRAWLEAEDHPTAVVCYTHHESAAILVACDRSGRRVPDDLSIAVVHDEPVTHYDVQVPTAELPEREIGKQAVAMLQSRINRPDLASEPVVVPLELVHAGQVARLPGS